MQLTVLSVAYPLVPVSVDTAGGAEQAVAIMDRLLVRAGARSIVMAAEGSSVRGRLIPTPSWSGLIHKEVRAWAAREHRRILKETLRGLKVDVVHFHGLDFHEYLPNDGVPCLATLHLPPAWYPPEIFTGVSQNLRLNCVSANQRASCPASLVPISTVHHGIDVEGFNVRAAKRDYALALGRICPEKGFHFAIGAAKRAGIRLIISGRVFPYEDHQRYFEREIAPRLDRTVRFVGPAGFRKKRRLLSAARCLLLPSTVAETSSLVAMEALACGTPVIAFKSGALPEIVEHGRTGFIVQSESEMADAIGRTNQLKAGNCRKSARERFSAARMAEEYFRIYREMIADHQDPQRTIFSCAASLSEGNKRRRLENRTGRATL